MTTSGPATLGGAAPAVSDPALAPAVEPSANGTTAELAGAVPPAAVRGADWPPAAAGDQAIPASHPGGAGSTPPARPAQTVAAASGLAADAASTAGSAAADASRPPTSSGTPANLGGPVAPATAAPRVTSAPVAGTVVRPVLDDEDDPYPTQPLPGLPLLLDDEPDDLPAEGATYRRRVRARLARRLASGGQRPSGVKAVLEPLVATHRAAHPKADLRALQRAYDVAETHHRGQLRKSGDPYITHPLAVATILAELGMDTTTLSAALLHDTVEDTGYTLDQL
ncbi:MAG: diphosphokinase / guanosine-3,5-bis(diphosphate) 3-diphosphatase, partial [Mycobacteriales bacterium]